MALRCAHSWLPSLHKGRVRGGHPPHACCCIRNSKKAPWACWLWGRQIRLSDHRTACWKQAVSGRSLLSQPFLVKVLVPQLPPRPLPRPTHCRAAGKAAAA